MEIFVCALKNSKSYECNETFFLSNLYGIPEEEFMTIYIVYCEQGIVKDVQGSKSHNVKLKCIKIHICCQECKRNPMIVSNSIVPAITRNCVGKRVGDASNIAVEDCGALPVFQQS